jgi:hypothetical protein
MPAEKGKKARDKANARQVARRHAEADVRNADHDLVVLRTSRRSAERQHDEGTIANIDREIRRVERRKADAERRVRELSR